MNLQRYYQAEFAEHAAVVERTRLALAEPIGEVRVRGRAAPVEAGRCPEYSRSNSDRFVDRDRG
jgi:hypothetical protein